MMQHALLSSWRPLTNAEGVEVTEADFYGRIHKFSDDNDLLEESIDGGDGLRSSEDKKP